ncbi:hypothetical protein [Phascolarctobacterium sp.]|uniref:hypothetical protein n=1 Tax=Phascolarctobacterium sp. TaxID=2049039 RepID=UPI002A8124B8|nr:hypothetical protein [Phascolarctobacterium sp.]MDY5046020.1 hypothetical protein [Phascolarctobacterium sp.]MEE1195175.1 hypothetical protein [Phascolarctobacterium sp.]MEE1230309.1 hypothetical protein [Phascolarctobacterium sp.]
MNAPNVLALSLEEAARRLSEAGFDYEVQTLLPPRDKEEDFDGKKVRKYVVRQQSLSCNKFVLTVVYRV